MTEILRDSDFLRGPFNTPKDKELDTRILFTHADTSRTSILDGKDFWWKGAAFIDP